MHMSNAYLGSEMISFLSLKHTPTTFSICAKVTFKVSSRHWANQKWIWNESVHLQNQNHCVLYWNNIKVDFNARRSRISSAVLCLCSSPRFAFPSWTSIPSTHWGAPLGQVTVILTSPESRSNCLFKDWGSLRDGSSYLKQTLII